MLDKFSVILLVLCFTACSLLTTRGAKIADSSWECGCPPSTDITYKVDLSKTLPRQSLRDTAADQDGVRNRSKRTTSTTTWEEFKVEIIYDNNTINDPTFVSPALADLIKTTVMPQVRLYYQGVLQVQPLPGPILLDRTCSDGGYYQLFTTASGTTVRACQTVCAEQTLCGVIPVPEKYLERCLQCNSASPCSVNDVTEIDLAGEGAVNGHFLLFVSVSDSGVCDSSSNVAGYASACQMEEQFDRPIAGYITLCKDRISSYSTSKLVALVKHELLHALVFSSSLYPFFRDADNNFEPQTARDSWGFPPKDPNTGYYVSSTDTIREVTYDDWLVNSGEVNHTVKLLVTPKVVEEARAYFNCSTLEGVELENQGASGTRGMHWEARILGDELMIGTSVCTTGKLSRLSLALLEDSGWYKPNYDLAEMMAWGRNEGCRFAQGSCFEHLLSQLSNNEPVVPFCYYTGVDGPSCSADRTFISNCSVTDYSEVLPIEYQYFTSDTRGGRYELFDYCPICCENTKTICDQAATSIVIDGRSMMHYPNTRCIQHSGEWTLFKADGLVEKSNIAAGCYQYECTDHGIVVSVYGTKYHCQCEGQEININVTDPETGDFHQGTIICPSCKHLCYDHNDVYEQCTMPDGVCYSTQSANTVYSPCDLPLAQRTCGSRSNCIEERVKNGYTCKCLGNNAYGCFKHFQRN